MKRKFILFASLSLVIAVSLGALGAHFLKSKVEAGVLTAGNLQSFEAAVRYQIYHALALLFLSLLAQRKLILYSGYFFMYGTILFSGSIYFLSTQTLTNLNFSWLGPVTPLGGLLFIVGWLLLFGAFLKKEKV